MVISGSGIGHGTVVVVVVFVAVSLLDGVANFSVVGGREGGVFRTDAVHACMILQ